MTTPASQPRGLDLSAPFTRQEAYPAGLTDRDLRSRRIVRVFRGVYVHADTTRTLALRARAALKVAPSTAMVSHHTAALLWGGAVPSQSLVHITRTQTEGVVTVRFSLYLVQCVCVIWMGVLVAIRAIP